MGRIARRNGAEPLARPAVLAYRLRAQDLTQAPPGRPGVLEAGIQDTPPGVTAPLALTARGAGADDPYADPELALVHSLRGTMHLHRAADLPLLAAALRPDDAGDPRPATHGPFFRERAAQGLPVGEVFDRVSDAMRRVMADGAERTKGALSTAVTPLVPEPLAPWCAGCGARHVHDGLFRMASLQAGLRLRPAGNGAAVFLPPTGGSGAAPTDPGAARREVVRRFLRRCGPASPETLAAWLGLATPAARRWWSALRDDLVEVDVDGRRLWCHRDDLPGQAGGATVRGVRLLPPYDPVVELADRALLVPVPSRRKRVWQAAANPGVLLVDGEIAGTWRQRRTRPGAPVTVTPFGTPPDERATARAAEALLGPVDLIIERPDP